MSGGINATGMPELLHRIPRHRARMKGDHLAFAADARRLPLDDENIGGAAFKRVTDQLDECGIHEVWMM